jgi:hypothetical protein
MTVALRSKADIRWLAKLAGSVANDPQRAFQALGLKAERRNIRRRSQAADRDQQGIGKSGLRVRLSDGGMRASKNYHGLIRFRVVSN